MDDSVLDAELDALKSKLRRLMELREDRDVAKQAYATAEEAYREKEAEVWDDLEESPLEGAVKLDIGEPYGVVTFTPRETYYGRVIDKDTALAFFESQARTDEFTEPKISKARINELVRECMESGKPLPAGIDFYAQRPVAITKQKGS